jgi:hypothetical protein
LDIQRRALTRVKDDKAVGLELTGDILPEGLEVGRAGDDRAVARNVLIIFDSLPIIGGLLLSSIVVRIDHSMSTGIGNIVHHLFQLVLDSCKQSTGRESHSGQVAQIGRVE